jgi:predicted ATPase
MGRRQFSGYSTCPTEFNGSKLILHRWLQVQKFPRNFLTLNSRDNEMNDNKSLLEHLENMKQRGIPMELIHLDPFTVTDVSHLISDIIKLPEFAVQSLAVSVHGKTQGNPFFVGRFLTALYRKNILVLFQLEHFLIFRLLMFL